MNDIPIDVSDPRAARSYATRYLWFIGGCAAMFAFFLVTRRQFEVYGWIWAVSFLLFPLYFRWRKIARLLEDDSIASRVQHALSQRGADFAQAHEVLRAVFDTATETTAVMADPRTWRQKQRLATFSAPGLQVFMYERNGFVGDLKVYLRPANHSSEPTPSAVQ